MTVSPPSGAPSATGGVRSVILRSGVYADSVKLMQVSRSVSALPGVTGVIVAMATPLNLELAVNMGLAPEGAASPDQLMIGIGADDDETLAIAVAAVESALAELVQAAAHEDRNLMPYLLECARVHASEGEIVEALQTVFGSYRETPVF